MVTLFRLFNVFMLWATFTSFLGWIFFGFPLYVTPVFFLLALWGRDQLIIMKHRYGVSGYENSEVVSEKCWMF